MHGVATATDETQDTKRSWLGRSHVRSQGWRRMVLVTANLLGMQLVWSTEMGMAGPYLLSLGVSKSTLAGVLLAGPISGLLVQPIIGSIADNCQSRLGRRRPFILVGGAICALSLILFGWARPVAALFAASGGQVHKTLTIWIACLCVWIIDFSVNAVQAADRALLVDVLPANEQAEVNAWAGRLTGIGAVAGFGIAEMDLPRYFGFLGSTQIQILSILVAIFFILSHLVTCWAVTERVLLDSGDARPNRPLDVFRDLWHAWLVLPTPIWHIYRIQACLWVPWYAVMFFSTTWVSEIYLDGRSLDSVDTDLVDAAARAGSTAMLWHAIINLFTTIVAPIVINYDTSHHRYRPSAGRAPNDLASRLKDLLRPVWTACAAVLPDLPVRWLTLVHAWLFANIVFAILLFATYLVADAVGAGIIIALTGFCWALTAWVPFALLGEYILQNSSSTIQPKMNGFNGSSGNFSNESFALTSSDRLSSADESKPMLDGSHDDDVDVEAPRDTTRDSQVLELHHGDSFEASNESRATLDLESSTPIGSAKEEAVTADSAGTIIGLHNIFVVLPQLFVSFCSTFIFAGLSPADGALPLPSAPDDDAPLFAHPRRAEAVTVTTKWDSIGLVFRLGGVAAAVAVYLNWRMLQDRKASVRARRSSSASFVQ